MRRVRGGAGGVVAAASDGWAARRCRGRSLAAVTGRPVARAAEPGRTDARAVPGAGRGVPERQRASGGAGGPSPHHGTGRFLLRRHGPGLRGRYRCGRGGPPPSGDAGGGRRTPRSAERVTGGALRPRHGRESSHRRRDVRAGRLRGHPALGIRTADAGRAGTAVRRNPLLRPLRQPQERQPGQHRPSRNDRGLGPAPWRGTDEDTSAEVLASYLYQHNAVTYACAFAGLRPTDRRAVAGPPDVWVELPRRDYWSH